jgi:hypothetical protein
MKSMLCLGMLFSAALVAHADLYWFTYDGNDFPENEGWIRHFTDPPAQRWLEDGSLFVDSRADFLIDDTYRVVPPGGYDPDPGETFVMQWRLLVHESSNFCGGVTFTSDQQHAVTFLFDEHRLLSSYESAYVELQPGVFHDFEMRSSDLLTYDLYVDGSLSLSGTFFQSLFAPGLGFGDLTSNGALVEWDYVNVGVVPEPPTSLLIVTAASLFRFRVGVCRTHARSAWFLKERKHNEIVGNSRGVCVPRDASVACSD